MGNETQLSKNKYGPTGQLQNRIRDWHQPPETQHPLKSLTAPFGAARLKTATIGILSAAAVVAVYGFSFWRIIARNRGNRVIECGSIALIVCAVMAALARVKGLPDWVLPSIGLLLFLLCLLTMWFLVLQGIQAIRHRKSKAALHE